ncbi:MAG TPA: hypothetical protein VI485_06495 [Vicinamibacterales bacterium]|nr:hypothetical protein [Vicinamibacterales bacterium]
MKTGTVTKGQRSIRSISARLGSSGSLPSFLQSIDGDPSLFDGVHLGILNLALQELDLALLRLSRAAVRPIRAESAYGSQTSESQGPYLQAVRETRLRALFGLPLLLLGIWLVYYCDRTVNSDSGWRGWLLWLSAYVCLSGRFILLLFRGSLSSLKDLL